MWGLGPGPGNGGTGSEGSEVFWVGYDSCLGDVKNDGNVSVLKKSWEAPSHHFCWEEVDAVGWIVFSVLRLTQLGYSSFILLAFVLSVVGGVPQKRHSHLLAAHFSLMFVSQPVDYGDVSLSPACSPEKLECFFLCCLESFLDLRFALDIADRLAQMSS